MQPTWNAVRWTFIIGFMTVPVQVFADNFATQSSTAPMTGSVQSVEVTNGNVMLKDRYGNTQTLQTNSSSTITRAGTDAKIPDLKPGDHVTVKDGTPVTQQ